MRVQHLGARDAAQPAIQFADSCRAAASGVFTQAAMPLLASISLEADAADDQTPVLVTSDVRSALEVALRRARACAIVVRCGGATVEESVTAFEATSMLLRGLGGCFELACNAPAAGVEFASFLLKAVRDVADILCSMLISSSVAISAELRLQAHHQEICCTAGYLAIRAGSLAALTTIHLRRLGEGGLPPAALSSALESLGNIIRLLVSSGGVAAITSSALSSFIDGALVGAVPPLEPLFFPEADEGGCRYLVRSALRVSFKLGAILVLLFIHLAARLFTYLRPLLAFLRT